jgi:hypothetical protein
LLDSGRAMQRTAMSYTKKIVAALIAISCVPPAHAQSARPSFDVATITLSQNQGEGDTGFLYSKLESDKGSFDVLVIDSVQKPSEN